MRYKDRNNQFQEGRFIRADQLRHIEVHARRQGLLEMANHCRECVVELTKPVVSLSEYTDFVRRFKGVWDKLMDERQRYVDWESLN